jgi:hypothetical protein
MVPVYGTMYWRLQFCAEKDLLDYAKVQDSKNDGQLMMKSNCVLIVPCVFKFQFVPAPHALLLTFAILSATP